MMKESRMFEGLTTCLNYCLERGLDDEAQVIEAIIKTWDKMDYYGKKNIYSTMVNLMRSHSMPRRPRSQLDEDLEDLKDLCHAAAKATWDIVGDYLLCHTRNGGKTMTLDYYQDLTYQTITRKIRMGVKEGFYKFERNKETGKLELIDLREEEE